MSTTVIGALEVPVTPLSCEVALARLVVCLGGAVVTGPGSLVPQHGSVVALVSRRVLAHGAGVALNGVGVAVEGGGIPLLGDTAPGLCRLVGAPSHGVSALGLAIAPGGHLVSQVRGVVTSRCGVVSTLTLRTGATHRLKGSNVVVLRSNDIVRRFGPGLSRV